MRPGVRLGIDVGSVRIGVASSDPQALIATPVATVRRDHKDMHDVGDIVSLAVERAAVEVVVGLPKSLSGHEGVAAQQARRYAVRLGRSLGGIPVRLWDERLTTVDAHRQLRASGIPSLQQRETVDQAAAVLILQSAMDAERSTGSPGGEVVGGRKRRRRSPSNRREGRQL